MAVLTIITTKHVIKTAYPSIQWNFIDSFNEVLHVNHSCCHSDRTAKNKYPGSKTHCKKCVSAKKNVNLKIPYLEKEISINMLFVPPNKQKN